MGIISPTKGSGKYITIPHWQSIWIDSHSSINFAGLIKELVAEVIKNNDPEYYERHKKYLDIPPIRKKEIVDHIVEKTLRFPIL